MRSECMGLQTILSLARGVGANANWVYTAPLIVLCARADSFAEVCCKLQQIGKHALHGPNFRHSDVLSLH